LTLALAFGVALGLGGCALGPKALEKTHGPYNDSVRLVYEEQLLRNIVRMRYYEAPSALDVNAIESQYELSTQAEARPFFVAPNPSNSNVIFKTFTAILPDVTASGTARPTISFNPVDDAKAIRQFLTPIPHETMVLLMETGWPVSLLLRLYVERLNGVPNSPSIGSSWSCDRSDYPRFQRIVELCQIVHDRDLAAIRTEERTTQLSGGLAPESITPAAVVEAAKNGMQYRPAADGKTWSVVRLSQQLVLRIHEGAAAAPEVAELESLLNLVPGLSEYELVIGAGVPDPLRHPWPESTQIKAAPRSTAQVFAFLANGVEVPPEHFERGLVQPTMDAAGCECDMALATRGLFAVHACKGLRPPSTSFIATKYRDFWYYIDDCDVETKATLARMLLLTRLDFGVNRANGPVLTLPVGR
jgi:hypothetical protein